MKVFALFRRMLCSHEFDARQMQLRNADGIVKWSCRKCNRVFSAECGLDILPNGKCVGGWGKRVVEEV